MQRFTYFTYGLKVGYSFSPNSMLSIVISFVLKLKMMLQGRVHGGIFTFFALATNIPITRQPPRQEKQKQQHKSSNKSKQLQNIYSDYE